MAKHNQHMRRIRVHVRVREIRGQQTECVAVADTDTFVYYQKVAPMVKVFNG